MNQFRDIISWNQWTGDKFAVSSRVYVLWTLSLQFKVTFTSKRREERRKRLLGWQLIIIYPLSSERCTKYPFHSNAYLTNSWVISITYPGMSQLSRFSAYSFNRWVCFSPSQSYNRRLQLKQYVFWRVLLSHWIQNYLWKQGAKSAVRLHGKAASILFSYYYILSQGCFDYPLATLKLGCRRNYEGMVLCVWYDYISPENHAIEKKDTGEYFEYLHFRDECENLFQIMFCGPNSWS